MLPSKQTNNKTVHSWHLAKSYRCTPNTFLFLLIFQVWPSQLNLLIFVIVMYFKPQQSLHFYWIKMRNLRDTWQHVFILIQLLHNIYTNQINDNKSSFLFFSPRRKTLGNRKMEYCHRWVFPYNYILIICSLTCRYKSLILNRKTGGAKCSTAFGDKISAF